jgi:hypothetical protein
MTLLAQLSRCFQRRALSTALAPPLALAEGDAPALIDAAPLSVAAPRSEGETVPDARAVKEARSEVAPVGVVAGEPEPRGERLLLPQALSVAEPRGERLPLALPLTVGEGRGDGESEPDAELLPLAPTVPDAEREVATLPVAPRGVPLPLREGEPDALADGDARAVRSALPEFREQRKGSLRSEAQGADTAVWLAAASYPTAQTCKRSRGSAGGGRRFGTIRGP